VKLEEAKLQFIASWGALAQIHALLLVSANPLSADDIMEELEISRGNANMNIRELINWGLVERQLLPGERKEYFTAEKDIWRVARQIVQERKKRELDPMIRILDQLGNVEGDKKDKDVKAFTDTINGIKKLGLHADKMLNVMVKADENWFFNSLIKFFK
jgi:DNA-binding transcriptional regulator GbsR (MarR family)